MTTQDLEERIKGCEETIAKKQNTIVKKNKAIEKILNNLHELGFKGNTYEELNEEVEKEREIDFHGEKFQEGYNFLYDLNEAMTSIKNNTKSIEAEKEKIAKYQSMLEAESNKMNAINNLPQNVIDFMNELEDNWNYFDKRRRDTLKEAVSKLNKITDMNVWKEERNILVNKYGRNFREDSHLTDEQIESTNKKLVNNLIIDFIDRVKYKVGEITSFNGLRLNRDNQGYAILNGYVEGTKDTAKVESIYAGGYNIQRLHVRVLVK